MTTESYKAFYLDSISEISDHYFILSGFPEYDYREDYYYEIHLESISQLTIIREYVDNWIYIDVISSDILEIYVGECYEDCSSDGQLAYKRYEYQEIEKTSKEVWKPKAQEMRNRLISLLESKLPEYTTVRNEFVEQYKASYNRHIRAENTFGLNITELSETRLFDYLYVLFDSLYNPHYLENLAFPNRRLPLPKDWKVEYSELEESLEKLSKVDLTDTALMKNHVINIYNNTFEHMLSNFKYNYANVDESKYTQLFNSVIRNIH
ncbi:hypothetical protein [Pedobacter caeni]|uniref:Uncharacterized protein n=1 Tax=Pedobacter caeni TaxID=288992 RepID=A0A1M4VDG2_9SPHI|nr:hypothetical protein [Pedobacter caeni]SHE67009.1 hypothetical protein SAMN04488522_101872 [Pedobacter caeni]